jgi:hypothetical protein
MSAKRFRRGATGRAATRQRGQTLVEFAIVLPIFLLALFALVDGSRLVFTNSTLSQAAREAARQASVEASWIGSSEGSCNTTAGPICPATVDVLKTHVVTAANRMATLGPIASANVYLSCDATTPPSGSWTTSSCSAHDSGDYVSVRVTTSFTAITPVISQILGTLQLSGSATMAIN